MKLICEAIDAEFITEKKADGSKSYFIEGVFMQGEITNKNGRSYPISVLDEEVQRYTKTQIKSNRAMGELGHPEGPSINLDRASHKILSLSREGNDFIGKAKLLDTPMGKIAKNLLDEGIQLGVSSRGMGSLKSRNGIMEVQGDFRLATAADIVADPSAPAAFVNGILEGVDWVCDESTGVWKTATDTMAKIVEDVKKADKIGSGITISEDKKLDYFKKYMDILIRN